MRPNIEVGEIGIRTATRDYAFRPGLSAMAGLGFPPEIVEIFGVLHSSPAINPYYPVESYRRWEREVLSAAYNVLSACCDDESLTELIGHNGSRYGSYVYGAMPIEDMPHIARALMRHGVTGNAKPRGKPKREEYSSEFSAKEHAAIAIAHLGMSEREAWDMTVSGISAAMQAKFGKPVDNIDDLLDTRESDMAWLDGVNRLRDKKVSK